MPRSIRRLGKVLLVLLCVLYPWFAHSAVIANKAPSIRFVTSLIPVLGLTYVLVKRAYLTPFWAAGVVVVGGLFAYFGSQAHWDPALSYGIPHAAINVFLFWLFASTLRDGETPLITRLAQRVHGTLTPEIVRYTRGVTAAWAGFFIAQIGISLLLYFFTPFSVWLVFITFLTFPLLAFMFLLEYIFRRLFHPSHPRVPVRKAIAAFSKDFAASREADVR